MKERQYQIHPLLSAGSAEYDITELHFFVMDEQTCVDVTLRRGEKQRRLRFVGCQSVKFKPATGPTFGTFPYLFDVSGDGLEGLRVLVADEDASGTECHLYLWAHDVVDLGASAQA